MIDETIQGPKHSVYISLIEFRYLYFKVENFSCWWFEIKVMGEIVNYEPC